MENRLDLPLVVITGPTASGKTSLAIEIAEKYNGEIICADSRTVYKYMDIGTAKPTVEERRKVPHWGLDLVEPGDSFSAAEFKKYAVAKIEEIRGRGKVPFLVGGTGLYIDSVVFDYQFGDGADEGLRRRLGSMGIEQLHEYCKSHNIKLPENYKNKRYVIRAIELNGVPNSRRGEPIPNSIIVGIATEKEELRSRIRSRIDQLFADGVVEESKLLGERYDWKTEALTGNVYRLMKPYLDGKMSMDEVKSTLAVSDWRLAKRQLTWMRRNKHIIWLSLGEAKKHLMRLLATSV